MKTFEIYFTDLTEEAQERFLEFEGIETPDALDYDVDETPICSFERAEYDDETDEFDDDSLELSDDEDDFDIDDDY